MRVAYGEEGVRWKEMCYCCYPVFASAVSLELTFVIPFNDVVVAIALQEWGNALFSLLTAQLLIE